MSADPILCPAETFRQTRDNPAEYCEEEVENEGDLCSRHDLEDRAEADYETYREAQAEDARYGL